MAEYLDGYDIDNIYNEIQKENKKTNSQKIEILFEQEDLENSRNKFQELNEKYVDLTNVFVEVISNEEIKKIVDNQELINNLIKSTSELKEYFDSFISHENQ